MTAPEILSAAQGWILGLLLLGATVTDCRRGKIPQKWCAAALLAGWGLSFARGGWGGIFPPGGAVGLCDSMTATSLLFVVFFVFYWCGGVGGGDVKLLSAVAALGGLKFSLWALLHIAAAGLPVALFLLLWRGEFWAGLRRAGKCAWRWRYPRADAVAPETASENAPEKGAPSSAGRSMPYALVVLIGVAWTVYSYWRDGWVLPVF